MTKNLTRTILTLATALLCVALIIFIFSNSLDNASESSAKSDAVHKVVNDTARSVGFKREITKPFIRQSAHVLEFAALGASSALTLVFALSPAPKQKLSCRLLFSTLSIPFCAFIALIDEYIQNFSDGRVFDVSDIFTDTCGSICGSIFTVSVFLILRLIFKLKQKKSAQSAS